ncbi:MAG: hypothetical protein DRN81_05920 [Thermoproteota archaeon]|nr:MAG: hypothetical protein DRN81_05920 [Candidatus Korarchaeota archaeon]
MGNLYIGIKLEGSDEDIKALKSFLESSATFDFKTLADIISRITKVVVVEIKEEVLYEKSSSGT